MTKVAILVPGIMGSELRLNEEVIWPGSLWELKLPYKKMDKLKDPNLVATDVIRSFSVSEQYQGLINDLAKCDFREDVDPPTLFICPHDWRKDNALSARVLADLIDKALAKHGEGIQISIIGHSMGGLISRYYLESGEFNSRPGFSHVKQLLTLGTPHRGAPLALGAALGLEKRLFLNASQVKELVSDTRYPSLYQLLPPPGEPFVWDEHKSAEYGQIDVYNDTVAQVLGLVPENLSAAKAFHSKLDINKRPQYDGKPIRYFFLSVAGKRQSPQSHCSR
jgi:phospholipase A1